MAAPQPSLEGRPTLDSMDSDTSDIRVEKEIQMHGNNQLASNSYQKVGSLRHAQPRDPPHTRTQNTVHSRVQAGQAHYTPDTPHTHFASRYVFCTALLPCR